MARFASALRITYVFGMCAAGGLVGCERSARAPEFKSYSGTVLTTDVDASELTLAAGVESQGQADGLAYVLNGECEIFVNDKVSTFEEIRPGCKAELLGYRSAANPRRIIVCQAFLELEQPTPKPPELTPPTTSPTAEERQPQEQ